MSIPAWLEPLRRAAEGVQAHQISRIPVPADGSGRPSAVLVLFGDSPAGPTLVLIERASTLRKHAGQAAFPGGSVDPEDAGPAATALREAAEEVDLDPSTVEVFGELPRLFLSASGFLVTPVLGYWHDPHPLRVLDTAEVADVLVVTVAELTAARNRFSVSYPANGFVGPGFTVGELFVWGFTAMVLDAVLQLGEWAGDWDRSVTREIPESVRTRSATAAAGTVET